ncbi:MULTISPECIES: jacalin-like lectin [Thermomonospora]|uniref:Endonuclease/exonuclease/phosphatase n=1 Tax=Thermomonospora curvata (strain ATCC 19995 / DSM 43183 / JCM 3096 / KCTC 9072 / NBRC 15933 / NCIMB 10081 / Henssen B9) TaxID=471852 RepID=D1A9N0_THECD|nr:MULTISPECIES: jacalin-like lectin [Thermomonospora]ACY98716.1 Endonuclease/exonuclease/phosphatase [Thermomonospora curvata DSM 43183]PKK13836.1 MAG: endonuclease [Thermomonospora sp. CIF 1]
MNGPRSSMAMTGRTAPAAAARRRRLRRAAAAVLASLTAAAGLPGPAAATAATPPSGAFSVLTYNIAGLPDFLSGSHPSRNIPLISPRLAPYDIVHVQEDFNYHRALYAGDNHPYRTPTSGIAGIGSGLNTLSNFPYDTGDFQRVTWKDCYIGTGDCLTPKGFTFMRVRLAEGVYVDFYNLHADAGSTSRDIAARNANLDQLTAFIQKHSSGNAVVVMGDTNTRYTRTGERIRQFAAANGLTDVWVSLIRGGTPPPEGGPAPACDTATVDNCEVVDKILFRGSKFLKLNAVRYRNERAAFLDEAGERLSDHDPIAADFTWKASPHYRFGEQFGGPHGDHYNDIDEIRPGARPVRLTMRSGARVDQVGLTLDDGTTLTHGGTGGTAAALELAAGEYVTSVHLCRGKRNGKSRIFYARFTTNRGNALSGGTTTSDCLTRTTPPGWQLAGFHGRSGAEVDKLGFIYTRRT